MNRSQKFKKTNDWEIGAVDMHFFDVITKKEVEKNFRNSRNESYGVCAYSERFDECVTKKAYYKKTGIFVIRV